MTDTDGTRMAMAGVLAASLPVASKGINNRGAMPSVGRLGLNIPSPYDVPSMFPSPADPRSKSVEIRLARATAASLLYSIEKKAGSTAKSVLGQHGRRALSALEEKRAAEKKGGERSCFYCRLFSRTLYADEKPAVIPLRHAAHVITEFDPDRCVSKAHITNYQILTRESVVAKTVRSFHPLFWHEAAPVTFLQSDMILPPPGGAAWDPPADPTSKAVREQQRQALLTPAGNAPGAGQLAFKNATPETFYLYERVAWPWSPLVTSEIDNALVISKFRNVETDTFKGLAYNFSLASCLASTLDLATEVGGLDIDDGAFEFEARPLDSFLGKTDDGPARKLELTDRDLAHAFDLVGISKGAYNISDLKAQHKYPPAPPQQVKEALREAGRSLKGSANDPVWVAKISSSKRLRFTAPGDTSPELWATLTWIAPALLFTFMNRAVCQGAHVAALR